MEGVIVLGFILFAALIFGGFVWMIIIGKRRAEERLQGLAALAADLGFGFSADDQPGTVVRFQGLSTFNRGHNRHATNAMWGHLDGREVVAFDYRYDTTETYTDKTGTHTREETHHLSAALVSCGCEFQGLQVRPENFLDKVAAVFGGNDIDFESHEFSRKFYVNGPDRKFAYDVITPQMMEYLLSCQGWSITLEGSTALIHTGRTWSPEDFRAAITVLNGFLDRVPHFVWKELGEVRESERQS